MAGRYRVAILGCRARGRAVGWAYREHPGTVLVGLCDLDHDRREALGDELDVAPRFENYDQMIHATQPDIVVITTATDLHYPLALRVLGHGVQIDVEKPLVTQCDHGDALLTKAKDLGVRIAVHHQGRVAPAMRAVAASLAAGDIGQPLHFAAGGKGYYGGYDLLNIGTHLLCSLLKLGGPCRAVSAVGLTGGRRLEPDDVRVAPHGMGLLAGEHLTGLLEFKQGLTGELRCQRYPQVSSNVMHIVVYGTAGRLLWQNDRAWRLPTPHFLPDGEHDAWEPLPTTPPEHYRSGGHAAVGDFAYVDEFITALDENRDHECSGAVALQVVEVMMGMFESAVTGRRVELPQTHREHPLRRWLHQHGRQDPEPGPREYAAWLAAEDERLARG